MTTREPLFRKHTTASMAIVLMAIAGADALAQGRTEGVEDLSLEALASVPVTSVTGRPEPLQRAAASIFVVSAEDIRRSGARSLPEALRLAPNLQVARLNASQWAITARGFNNTIGNKLLVLVDGRTIYSPLYSGVLWDAQEILMEDIERIEVISGPGATLWGANAVNGVINVITKPSSGTQGTLASASVDRSERRLSARQGFRLGGNGSARLYALQNRRDETQLSANDAGRGDDTKLNQVGFRADWAGEHTVAVQGDAYEGGGEGLTNLAAKLSGANLLARVGSGATGPSTWQFQVYLDRAKRWDDLVFRDTTDTVDVTFNQSPQVAAGHKILWGLGHRTAWSKSEATSLVKFNPEKRTLRWSHVFVQDEISVTKDLRATLGTKIETNVYTGAEVLPSVRLAYDLADDRLMWASLSRAVRSPARLDRDFYIPAAAPYLIEGGPNFRSEIANVLEVGYRGQHAGSSLSATAFIHEYDHLRAGTDFPTTVDNRASGKLWGLEMWASRDVARGWRLSAGWLELRKSLRKEDIAPASSIPNLGNDPRRQLQLKSSADITSKVQLDVAVRYVAALPDPHVPSYTAADLRVGWRLTPEIDVSLYGRDLGRRRHYEFSQAESSWVQRTAGLRVDVKLP